MDVTGERTGEAPRGVVTLVFTDIQSYSEMSERYRGAFRPLLEQHNQLLRGLCRQYHGYEVKALGDAFFFAFGSVEEAAQFALHAQHAVLNASWQVVLPDGSTEELPLRIRIGIHTGEPEPIQHPDGAVDYVGPDVNRASRVCSAAHGGQILLSSATQALLMNTLGDTVQFRNLGQYWLKGVGRERLWQMWQESLPEAFPPPSAPRAELHNLTVAETPLVGREREVAELAALVLRPNHSLTTLVGPSGVGKTRLVQAVAEALLEHFADGVWFVPLDGLTTPEAITQRIIQELPMQPRADSDPLQQLVAYAQGRSILLVLDSIESTEAVAQVVRALIQGAVGVRLLIASLKPLNLRAEHLYEVKPLSVPPTSADRDPMMLERYGAVQLLLEGARRHVPDFQITLANAPAIAELCRQLDGLPLALELAAARLALLSPADILKRLDERFQILQTRSPDMPPRQRALQSAIEWSYCQLEPSVRAFFEQLGVFSGSFTVEDVEAVCESDTPLDDLLELHQRAMLVETHHKDARRFRLLNPMRLFALGMLREKPEAYAAVRQRHAEHFLRAAHACLAQVRTPVEDEAMCLAELQMDNMRSALEWFTQQGDWARRTEMALCLSQLCDRLGWLLNATAYLQEALDTALFLGEAHDALLAELTLQRAALLYERHEWEEALQTAQDALARYEPLGSTKGQAQAHNLKGLILLRMQRFDEAHPHFQRALQGFMQTNAPVWAALVMNNFGLLEYERGRLEEAVRFFQQAAQRQRALGDLRGLSETLNNLGAACQLLDNLEAAMRYLAESLEYEVQIGNRLGIARGLCNIGEVLMMQGKT
ncbi:MAG: tetratricopeptide repeat protein, partial [Fimbriimonadales bacterium]|nr:tetratricopeptide repeat protein [Fimbriimonadales bacterium]